MFVLSLKLIEIKMQLKSRIRVFRDQEPVIIPWVLQFDPCPLGCDWKIPNIESKVIDRIMYYAYHDSMSDVDYYMMYDVYGMFRFEISNHLQGYYETNN